MIYLYLPFGSDVDYLVAARLSGCSPCIRDWPSLFPRTGEICATTRLLGIMQLTVECSSNMSVSCQDLLRVSKAKRDAPVSWQMTAHPPTAPLAFQHFAPVVSSMIYLEACTLAHSTCELFSWVIVASKNELLLPLPASPQLINLGDTNRHRRDCAMPSRRHGMLRWDTYGSK